MSSFDDWYNGLTGFTFLSERFIAECKHMDVSDKNIKRLEQWLKSAWEDGYNQRGLDDSED